MLSNLLQTARGILNSLIWVVEYSPLMKKPIISAIILTLQFFFEGQSDQGVTRLVIKPFDISQTSRIVGLSYKNCQVFPNPLFYFFRQYLT